MIKPILAIFFGLAVSCFANAQEYGLGIGVHQTTASVDSTSGLTGSVSGKLGFDLGLHVAFELVPNLRFRTGFIYDQRQFDYKYSSFGGGKIEFNFAYLDVPVNLQYNFNEMVAVYGGLIVGVKASDSIKAPSALGTMDFSMKSMYPLFNAGVNLMFDDMIGFDFFLEHGIGEFASDSSGTSLKDYSTFGMRFIYWM